MSLDFLASVKAGLLVRREALGIRALGLVDWQGITGVDFRVDGC